MSRRKPVAYVLGPMTGIQDDNRPMFDKVTEWLREEQGYRVISPAELDDTHPVDHEKWTEYMRRDITKGVMKADLGVALPGWRNSRGATLEALLFRSLGVPVYEVELTRVSRIADRRPVRMTQTEDWKLPYPAHPTSEMLEHLHERQRRNA